MAANLIIIGREGETFWLFAPTPSSALFVSSTMPSRH
jgi:hypothetical protein